ncbi:1,6-anhydro-N-acetylmuramyl-L-alanine amidase AmpD [Atopomonas sediminilitoris]|uniref:1,6-anhydro-N-acetylmuramyl-L-alanine amidase AmpD n=1 Tax=Atopomonas sediminilitoris TaxID=2919919 RepID=UPI001F4D59B2|nr:1,6-anhydro-N-acetylmuramyl-L-alanine amidase AmpD [Atopomonas sediminilitoris]MCJ8168488.1 1,6-anhydro-N-acetylmuramyl-L-alanine amidase AmpD [Atopomonas sediminilitoris]
MPSLSSLSPLLSIEPQTGWCNGATVCPSPHFNQRPDPADISLLVIHNISLPPRQFGTGWVPRFFAGQLDPAAHPYFAEIADLRVSAHFFIERDGALTQFVSCNDRAWHAGQSCFAGREACNDYAIGIELEGCDDVAYTEAQYVQLQALTVAIQAAYPAVTAERITGHEHIAPGRKTDPGAAFDWQRYRTALQQGERS